MNTIWFERPPLEEFLDRLQHITRLAPNDSNDPFSGIETANGVIASAQTYNAALFERAPRLLVVSRTGIGYETVDTGAATEYGIAVCNTPDGPTISTAEFALALLFATAKNLKRIEAEMRHGLQTGTKFFFYRDYKGVELDGKQLGLVGLGRIGSHVARIAMSIGMHVAAYDPYADPQKAASMGVTLLPTLEELLRSSDVVSLHIPHTPETHKLMNAERFAQMKRGAIFINTARGGHVDEAALLAALDSGHLFGAGLDVTDPEPPESTNPLLFRENVIITPHIASGTFEGRDRMFEMAFDQILQVFRGEHPPYLINPEVWPRVLEKLSRA